MCVCEENELRGFVWGGYEAGQRTHFVSDLVTILVLTCSISQSDLQRRKRYEPTELKGVRISAGGALLIACPVPHEEGEEEAAG